MCLRERAEALWNGFPRNKCSIVFNFLNLILPKGWNEYSVMAHTHVRTDRFTSPGVPTGQQVSDVTGLSLGYLHFINSILHYPGSICICSTS